MITTDPYYSLNLTRSREDFSMETDRTDAIRYDLISRMFQ
jgi:hypothetical protein